MTNTTAASKYMPKRSIICIIWNPPCQTQIYLVKVSLNVFENFMKWGLKGGDFHWCRCCDSICHQLLTFIQICYGHTVHGFCNVYVSRSNLGISKLLEFQALVYSLLCTYLRTHINSVFAFVAHVFPFKPKTVADHSSITGREFVTQPILQWGVVLSSQRLAL